VGGSERVISYCAEEHGGRGVYLNKGGIEYSCRSCYLFSLMSDMFADVYRFYWFLVVEFSTCIGLDKSVAVFSIKVYLTASISICIVTDNDFIAYDCVPSYQTRNIYRL
jgi:hypothetical protein